jgi:hypothetical protein
MSIDERPIEPDDQADEPVEEPPSFEELVRDLRRGRRRESELAARGDASADEVDAAMLKVDRAEAGLRRLVFKHFGIKSWLTRPVAVGNYDTLVVLVPNLPRPLKPAVILLAVDDLHNLHG